MPCFHLQLFIHKAQSVPFCYCRRCETQKCHHFKWILLFFVSERSYHLKTIFSGINKHALKSLFSFGIVLFCESFKLFVCNFVVGMFI